jgi:RimJ/RimL family protein N-acetyltransferase
MIGRFCRLEPLDPMRHAEDLHAANALDLTGRMWGYLSYGPFDSVASYRAYMETHWLGDDPLFLAIIDQKTGQAVGVASYLRIEPLHGVIEVGHLAFSPLLQRTAAATEAMYLMMERIFTLGYRRYEWKCHALNAPSRAAAQRLGFSFEGVFRQAMVTRGRNRDTAWYSIIDPEWPALREAFHKWLAPSNFDGEGRQKESLSNWTASLLQNKG